MKKATRKPTKTSKTPPKGWPSEEIITEAERKMKGGLASKLISPDAGPVGWRLRFGRNLFWNKSFRRFLGV